MQSLKEKMFLMMGVAILGCMAPALASTTQDTLLESATKNSHVYKTYLRDDAIQVKSTEGVITLTGTVSSRTHKSLAEDTAANMTGTKRVMNQLVVKSTGVKEGSDQWIESKVKMSLLFHRNVNGLKTQVGVKEGAVTLKGEANSQVQKDLTTEYAKDIDGVKSVNNELKVMEMAKASTPTMGDKIDDASITAQVKMVLVSHRSTSAMNTKVKTNDGVVGLSGNARSAAEKDLVTKLVEDVNGVKIVENHMTVTQ